MSTVVIVFGWNPDPSKKVTALGSLPAQGVIASCTPCTRTTARAVVQSFGAQTAWIEVLQPKKPEETHVLEFPQLQDAENWIGSNLQALYGKTYYVIDPAN